MSLGIIGSAFIVGGCGGGGGDGSGNAQNTPPPPPPPPASIAGVFKDANVQGLSYTSGGESGITDGNGSFDCETSTSVAFSIGAIQLGSTDCATLVMPQHLAGSGSLTDAEALNLTRFLLMLDMDGDPVNGIRISEAVQEVAETWPQPDFTTGDLDAELAGIISDSFSVDQTMHDLPDAAEALMHVQATAACAYSGAFRGSMSGDLSGAFALVIGFPGLSNTPFRPDSAGWVAFDSEEEFFAGGGGSNSVTYAARPVIDHSGPNLAGPFDGTFETPDHITGRWESAANGVNGTYTVDRIDTNTDTWRLMGTIAGADIDGVVALGLTGNVISGEAFEVFEGQTYGISGTLDGDSVSLTATGGGETIQASGTLTRDAFGDPMALSVSFTNGALNAAACRLN